MIISQISIYLTMVRIELKYNLVLNISNNFKQKYLDNWLILINYVLSTTPQLFTFTTELGNLIKYLGSRDDIFMKQT